MTHAYNPLNGRYVKWSEDPNYEARARRRFEEKYVVDEAGCWLWQGSTHGHNGYGQFCYQGRPVYAHRASYRMFVGSVPRDLDIDHLCGVRHCVNPEHLEPVTRRENVRRGKATKLTSEDVLTIRAELAEPLARIMERYGISAWTVVDVALGRKNWSDLNDNKAIKEAA